MRDDIRVTLLYKVYCSAQVSEVFLFFSVFSTGGNDQMKVDNFAAAVEFYSKAIAINPQNAVYYCNRLVSISSASLNICCSFYFKNSKIVFDERETLFMCFHFFCHFRYFYILCYIKPLSLVP